MIATTTTEEQRQQGAIAVRGRSDGSKGGDLRSGNELKLLKFEKKRMRVARVTN